MDLADVDFLMVTHLVFSSKADKFFYHPLIQEGMSRVDLIDY